MGFKRMNACIRKGENDRVAYEMLDSKWAGQVGKRAERLARAWSGDVDALEVKV
jgi:hypothetical protein